MANSRPYKVTVFYNSAASDGKAAKMFEKNAKPLLHLSGCDVRIIRTDYEGQAKSLMSVLEDTDMIVAAGGDGTVNEVITGLLRRPDADKWSDVPIGVIPLGRTNSICHMLSKGDHEHEDQQQWIVESTESLFSGRTTRVDVLKVETNVGKDTYALTDIRWGAYREAHKSYSSWWFLPGAGMKGYAAHLRRCFKPNLVSELDVSYNSPLEVHKPVVARPSGPFKTESTFFLQKMVASVLPSYLTGGKAEPPSVAAEAAVAAEELPEELFEHEEADRKTVEFMASANVHKFGEERSHASIRLTMEPAEFDQSEFVNKGPGRVVDGRHHSSSPAGQVVQCGKLKLTPKSNLESCYAIDNEDYEAVPCTIELLPNKLKMCYLPMAPPVAE